MDLMKTNITNLTEYISFCQDVLAKHSQMNIKLNISTIVMLNKYKSLEVEYFEKCKKAGAVFQILENMLQVPPSKSWDDLSKKLLSLLKFWFNKLQHKIMQHNSAWWNFLQQLLYFVKELRTKGPLTNCKLIEVLGEDFLQLTTNEKLDLNQRYETLQCFNVCCSELSRESRLALRKNFEEYFPKLAHMLPSWGDFRLQFSTMETLLRWLLSRKELSVRKEVATSWFPQPLYSTTALRVFLDRDWKNFYKDARDFLNAQNENNSSIISLICKRIKFGDTELIAATDKKYWLDFNIDTKCISLMLELRLLEVLRIGNAFFDALVIKEDNTRAVKMTGNAALTKIEIALKEPLHQCSEVLSHERELCIYLNAINADRVSESLERIFENKFENPSDAERFPRFSPNAAGECSQIENSEDSRQFAVHARRPRQSRVAAATLNVRALKSPSTTSTTSLLLLKEKLAEYPGCLRAGNEEYSGVCAKPLLARVTEESEENICPRTPRLGTRCDAVFSGNSKAQQSADKTALSKDSRISLVLATTIDSYEGTFDGFPQHLELNTLNYMAFQQQSRGEAASQDMVGPEKDRDMNCSHVEADVVECVDDLVDHVCVDREIISNLMNPNEFTKKLLPEAALHTSNLAMDRPVEDETTKKTKSQPLQITFPKTKRGNKTKGQSRRKKPASEAVGKLAVSYETDDNFKSPNRKTQRPNARRRRKLYSPKDELVSEGAAPLGSDEDGGRTPTTSKAPYREMRGLQATHRDSARRPVPEKASLSPRAKRVDDAFDRLLQGHCEGADVKKSDNKRDISIYNFTDSDDSDFAQSYASVKLSETKARKRKHMKTNVERDTLVDEKMRNTVADLNASLIIEQPMDVCDKLEPRLAVAPAIDPPHSEDTPAKKAKGAKGRPNKKKPKPKNSSKRARPAQRRNSKRLAAGAIDLSRDREESLSPGLRCEVQLAEKGFNDSIGDLEKIHVLEKATRAPERCADFERIQTAASIEHVPARTVDKSDRRFPRVSIERMSEEDINKYAPRANSVFGSSLSGGASPKPELSDRPASTSHCEMANDCPRPKRISLILPFQFSKKLDSRVNGNTPRRESEDKTEIAIGRGSSIKAVSLKVQTPKPRPKRVLQTPSPKGNASRSKSSSDSGKRRITRRAARRVSFSSDEENCANNQSSNAEAVHQWLDRSQQEIDDTEDASVKMNVFGDIFKAVQDRIDERFAAISLDARTSLEHIQRGVAQQLEAARLRRQAFYRETTRKIFSEMGKLLNDRFTELEDKCESLDDELLEGISRDSAQALHELATRQLRLGSFLERATPP